MKTLQERLFIDIHDHTLFEKVKDHAMEYVENAFERNVYPTSVALDNLQVFEEPLNEETIDAHTVIDQLNQFGAPATVSQIGGRYFGFVNGSVIPTALAAKNLSIFWDQNTAMQVISPLSAKLETVVQNWLVNLLGLPKETVAGFVSGTSMANFCALAAAKYKILKHLDWDVNKKGLNGAPKIRIVTCTQAHSTIIKAISLNGFGTDNIEWVDVDKQGRIIPSSIPELDNHTILILQAGNVNSGAFDPYDKICAKARQQGAWIHIDGAFGLWAAGTKQLKHLTIGFENADSWAVDAHKTLNLPYDSGILLCRHEEALISSLHMSGGYLIKGKDRDGMFYTPEMSKRARVIELWAAMKHLGKNGIDELVFQLHERAKQFSNEISQVKGFEVLNEVVFNQVIVKCKDDNLTQKVTQTIQELRECWIGGSVWKEKKVIRISVCSWATTVDDIQRSVYSFKKALEISLAES